MDFSPLQKALSDPDRLLLEFAGDSVYRHDATEHRATPAAVLRAGSTDDVIAAVMFCKTHSIPITIRGTGTGLSGGCVASPGALVVATDEMDDLEINVDDRIAICGPGVITRDIQDMAARFGLTYPPDPASYAESTIGGNVAEGAGGLRCKKYGVTKDYVLGLEAVTAGGELLRTGIFAANRGFSTGDVLIASEGTLAIITRIAVRLTPLPGRGTTILAAFRSMPEAAQTVADLTVQGIVPTVLEFVDGDAIACVNEYEKAEGLDRAAAVLLIETSAEEPRQAARIEDVCRANSVDYLRTESEPERADELWRVRRNVSNAVRAIAAYAVSEDVVVPISKFPDLVRWVGELNAGSPLRINSFGHAGDGNLHVYFISKDGSERDRRRIEAGIEALMRKTVELGGTITGEHGIGLAKREYLGLEFDPATLGAMRKIKDIFDPQNLLNPDKLFPPPVN